MGVDINDRGTITLKLLPWGWLTGDLLSDRRAICRVMGRMYFRPTEAAFNEILIAMSAEGCDIAFGGGHLRRTT